MNNPHVDNDVLRWNSKLIPILDIQRKEQSAAALQNFIGMHVVL